MARKKQTIDISETIFRPTPLLEHYRRTVGYLEAHHAYLVAGGASKREVATLTATLEQMRLIVSLSHIYPPDTPEPEPEPPRAEQPLCHAGDEEWMTDFIAGLAS